MPRKERLDFNIAYSRFGRKDFYSLKVLKYINLLDMEIME